jgi:hypothetical protein
MAYSNLHLSIPAAGAEIDRHIETGDRLVFDFPIESTTMNFVREGNDLQIAFDNGGTLILEDFFSFMDVNIAINANTELSGRDFLSALAPELMVGAGEERSGNLGSYDDNAGNLIGGIDALGALGAAGAGAGGAGVGSAGYGLLDTGFVSGDANLGGGDGGAHIAPSVTLHTAGDAGGRLAEGSGALALFARVNVPSALPLDITVHAGGGGVRSIL